MTNQTLQRIEKEIEAKVPPDKRDGFLRTVIAGEKIMFDEKTHANMELVKNPEARKDPVRTIAQGIAGLMWLMFMQSKQKMPYEVMIFAGTVLMCKAIDFAERGLKIPFDNDMIAQTTKLLAEQLFTKLGITPEQLQEAINKGAQEIQDNQGAA